eukprot:396764_1
MKQRWPASKDKLTVTILNGYIRTSIGKSYFVPADMKIVICTYIGYRYMYEGQYTWTVNNKLLNQMKNSKNQRKFLSGTFQINELEFQIEAYPNGYKPEKRDVGSFQIFLKLINVPETFTNTPGSNSYNKNYKLIVFRRIFSQQVKSSYSRISQYMTGTSKGWADYCLGLNEICKNKKLDCLNFTIQLQILRIYEEHQFNWTPTQIIYENPILYSKRFENQSFKWIIKDELMSLMQNAYPGKQFESDIYNKMWCLNIAPNGASPKWKDYFDMFLVLCALPKNINKINVRWQVIIKELNIKRVRNYWFDCDKKNCNDCWTDCDDQKILSFKEFKLYKQVIVCLDIQILKMINHENQIVKEKEWDKYLIKDVQNVKTESQSRPIEQIMESFGDNAFQIYNIEENTD